MTDFDKLIQREIIFENILNLLDAEDIRNLENSSPEIKKKIFCGFGWSLWILNEFSANNFYSIWNYYFRAIKYYETFEKQEKLSLKNEKLNRSKIISGIRTMNQAKRKLFSFDCDKQPKKDFNIRGKEKFTALTSDSKRICAGDNKGNVSIYDIFSGKMVDNHQVFTKEVLSVQIIDNFILSSGNNFDSKGTRGQVVLTDMINKKNHILELPFGHQAYYATYYPIYSTVISVCLNDKIVLNKLNMQSDLFLQKLKEAPKITDGGLLKITTYAESSGRIIVGNQNKVGIIDILSGETLKIWEFDITYDYDEDDWEPIAEISQKHAFMTMPQSEIRMWNLEGVELYQFSGHDDQISSFSVHKEILITGSISGEICIHQFENVLKNQSSTENGKKRNTNNHSTITASKAEIAYCELNSFFVLSMDKKSNITKWSLTKDDAKRQKMN